MRISDWSSDVCSSDLYLPAYHNWPGFFMASAWIAELFSWGPLEIAAVASYAPPVFEVANLVVLYAVFLKFTDDRRLVYLAQFIFLAGNWIGPLGRESCRESVGQYG